MPRNLSSSVIAALSAPIINPAIFVMLTFGTIVAGLVVPFSVYMWSGIGSISWNGQTWLGLGSLLNISTIEDGCTVEARGIVLTLSGLDPNLLPAAQNELILGLPVAVYLALYDSTNTLIGTPITSWSGRIDQPEFSIEPTEVTLTINCENVLLDMNIAVDRRYTIEDAQLDNPGDLGFQFVNGLQEKNLFWGEYPISSNNI